MNQQLLKEMIDVSAKRKLADVVIKNGKIVNVFTREIMSGDVAIYKGKIVGIGSYEGKKMVDAEGRYICPGFIDGHIHIESSLVTPQEFARMLAPHGVTTAICDPHEIANVAGKEGIQFMLDDAKEAPIDLRFMLPSCVPATSFEHAGATLLADDLAPFFSHPSVLGLAEVMDYPAVLTGEKQMLDKLTMTQNVTNQIDGHAAGLNIEALNVYRTAGIRNDHEAVTAEEALDRLRLGFYVMIRQGSGAKDLPALISIINEQTARRLLFCTDDKHLDELIEEGTIDHSIRLAIQNGIDPLVAIQMATLNAAECFGLYTKGAVAPGYEADLLLLNDLETISIYQVWRKGQLIAQNGTCFHEKQNDRTLSEQLTQSVYLPSITKEQLQIPVNDQALVMEIIPNTIMTKKRIESVIVKNGLFVPSTALDQLKITVIERHHRTGNIGLGIVKGMKLQRGAIATTIAHDSHNLIAVGTNDEDMLTCIQEIERMQGGIVVADNGKIIGTLPLHIGGLMSKHPAEQVVEELYQLEQALQAVGAPTHFNPLLTLSFLALPVIRELKITDMGLFDVTTFQHISVAVQ
jgi:adenine deaminase